MRCIFAQNRFSWLEGQLLPIHTIHILKAIVPVLNLVYLGTLYVHPVIHPIFCNVLGINWQYQLKPCPIQEIHTRDQPHYHPPPQGHLRLRVWRAKLL